MTIQPERNTTERRRPTATTSRPANRPTNAPKKPSAARTAPPVQTTPRDAHDSERWQARTGTKVAEEAWHAGGRLLDRVRGNR
jgi:hypothetical protein